MYQQCGVIYVNPNCTANYTTSAVGLDSFDIRTIELHLITILCVLGLIGNILSVIVLRRDRERKDALFLLQALAVADAFYLVLAILRNPLKYLLHDEITYFSMQLTVFPLLKTAQAMTIWMMLLVTTDRYIYVCRPLVAPQLCNNRTRHMLAILVVIMAFIYNIPRFFDSCVWTFKDMCTSQSYSRMVYSEPFNNTYYFDIYLYAAYLLLLYIGPLGGLIGLNYKLLAAIRRSLRRQRQFALPIRNMWQQQPQATETNASIVLIIVVIVFVVCETPELVCKILIIIARWFPEQEISRYFLHTFSIITELLMVLNSSVNFLIYCAFGRRFRFIMKETFKGISRNL